MNYDIQSQISHRAQHLAPSGIRVFFDLVIGMKDIISLGVGEPDFDTPWSVRESAIFSIEKGETSYTSNMGLLELRKQIAHHLKIKHGLEYDPETEILITVGVSEAMDLATRALFNAHDKVLIPEPCFVSYHATTYLTDAQPVYISTLKNKFKVTAEDIKRHKNTQAKAIILNYPSNPTGVSYSKSELSKIAKTVKDLDLFVISDEVYEELTYDMSHTAFASLPGMKERTLLLNGFSKAYAMTGWRIGYAAGPKPLIEAMNKIHQYTIMCAPIMAQTAALEALKNSHPSVIEMRKEYLRRRNFIVDRLNEIGLPCHMPEGAFYAFPSVKKTGMDSMTFAMKLLEKKRVALVPGTAFGPSGEGYLRLSYATSLDQIREALQRIEEFLKERL